MTVYRWQNIIFDTEGSTIISSNRSETDRSSRGLFTSWWYETTVYKKGSTLVEITFYYSRVWPFPKRVSFIKCIRVSPDLVIV